MDNIKINETASELQINYHWKTPTAYFLVFFCIFWDGFMAVWFGIAFTTGEMTMALFGSIHALVGVGLTYFTITRFVNSTTINIDRSQIKISHGPLPWGGNKVFESKDLKQLYVERTESQTKNGGISYNYNLRGIMRDGSRPVIISQYTLSELSTHKQLEQQIERYLHITDYQVEGEFSGDAKPKAGSLPRGFAGKDAAYIDYRLKDLRLGFVMQYDLKNWEVVYEEQYDWETRTDRFLQISSENNTMALMYLQQDLSLTLPWLEERLDAQIMSSSRFQAQKDGDKVVSIRLDGEEYLLKETSSGMAFFKSDSQQSSAATQRLYLTSNHRRSLRLINTGMQLSVYHGEQLASHEFSNILPSQNN